MKTNKREPRQKKSQTAPSPSSKKKISVNSPKITPFYIVGMGGSAGGLEAFGQFFTNMPTDSGMAFVLVSHLDPTQKGMMPELLQRFTRMQVFQVKDGMEVCPNCVYVIPPNRDMSILHGTLQLLETSAPRGLRLPIDFFFRHLAEDQEERAVGVILSGMGTDGTLGIKAIREKLGMVMVEDPASAKFDGMPRSAIDTGIVDYIGPVKELPAKLLDYAKHPSATLKQKPIAEEKQANAIQKITVLLRDQTGHDFSFYKKNTLVRRIERRMCVHKITTIDVYIRYLRENPPEIELLFNELLIGVTNFFRDHEAFEALKENALPQILKDRARGNVLRIWVPGCSTGEEAYSIAIILLECLEKVKQRGVCKIQVFATDIDKDAIDKARQGVYASNIAADVSPERLQRFFIKEDNGYRLKKEIREMVVFAPQNVIMDPPFTKLDLVSCRNVLIYMTAELQKKLLPLLHYALNPGGLLFLGVSETIGSLTDLFSTVDNKWRIYRRKESASARMGMFELPVSPLFHGEDKPQHAPKARKSIETTISDTAQQVLSEHFTPPAVIINEKGDIVYISGRTGKYLEPAAGKTNINIFAMAREGLRSELEVAIRRAIAQKKTITMKDLMVRTNGNHQAMDLTVKPFSESEGMKGLLMVVFGDVGAPSKRAASGKAKTGSASRQGKMYKELEKELAFTRERLQTIVEEMETSREELKSSNEELQSTNEELQSTNEELTTSKEELQSMNEELVTVNTELQTKIDELAGANNDMQNLLNNVEIATIFLDDDLNVRRFTPQTTKILNLIPSDVGRPIAHIVSNLKYEALFDDIKAVLQTLVFKEAQVQTKDGRWYLMRIMP
ncbi:MAG: CheR family methyltransferase, partial [Planctomycetota bacterium]